MTTGLRRKLASGREATPTDLGLLRAFRKSIPRVAQDELGLALGVIGAHQKRLALANLSEGLNDDWLLLTLAGATHGLGAVCMEPVLVSALVQYQTLGSVADEIDPERKLTSTDGALAAPLIDAILVKIRSVSAYGMFQVERRVPDVRNLVLPLDADSYLRADLTIDIDVGKHQGQIIFLLPEAPAPKDDAPERDPAERAVMKDTAMVVKAEIHAVMARMSMTLDKLSALKAGHVLPLPDARMHKTELVAIDGRKVATGRLGQCDGFRAVRINPVGQKPSPIYGDFGPHRTAAGSGRPALASAPDMSPPLSPDATAAEITELAGLNPDSGNGLPALTDGELPPLDGGVPDLGAGELPPLDAGLPELNAGDLPPLGGGDLPELGDLPDLPDLNS